MIGRKQRYRVSFRDADRNQKIQAIKILRRLTGLGLKEAKDAVEETMGRNGYDEITEKAIMIPPKAGSSLIDLLDEHKVDTAPTMTPGNLRELGASVIKITPGAEDKQKEAVDNLRLALAAACNAQNDELTMDILLIIQKYTP